LSYHDSRHSLKLKYHKKHGAVLCHAFSFQDDEENFILRIGHSNHCAGYPHRDHSHPGLRPVDQLWLWVFDRDRDFIFNMLSSQLLAGEEGLQGTLSYCLYLAVGDSSTSLTTENSNSNKFSLLLEFSPTT